MAVIQYYGTGRRKTSTARVFLRPGKGSITINDGTFEGAFPTEALRSQIKQPLLVTETADKFDVLATLSGGGVAGQAGALRLGIEGRVILLVTIDETGAVVDARVVQDPGHGLGEAAARAYKRRCRFEPGRRGDQRVATTIRVGVTFEMP